MYSDTELANFLISLCSSVGYQYWCITGRPEGSRDWRELIGMSPGGFQPGVHFSKDPVDWRDQTGSHLVLLPSFKAGYTYADFAD